MNDVHAADWSTIPNGAGIEDLVAMKALCGVDVDDGAIIALFAHLPNNDVRVTCTRCVHLLAVQSPVQ